MRSQRCHDQIQHFLNDLIPVCRHRLFYEDTLQKTVYTAPDALCAKLHLLHTELEELQIPSTCYDAGYLIAQIPETAGYEEVPRIALLAHVDTSPEAPGEKVSPCLHPNYDGKRTDLSH